MSFKERFRAWWEGYEYIPHTPVDEYDDSTQADGAASASEKVEQWSTDRFGLIQALWGDGLVFPGGKEHLLKLVSPFGLNPAFSAADFGAGLGGGGEIVAEEYGAWVNGYEFDPERAAFGEERAERLGLSRKAPVSYLEPDTFTMRDSAYHCAFAVGAFYWIENKSHLLRMIEKGLHPGGQFTFTDYVLTSEEAKENPAVQGWMTSEDPVPQPWTAKHYEVELVNLNLDVRISEDMSEQHQKAILEGWATLTAGLKPGGLAPETMQYLVEEAERWVRRVGALRSGGLRYQRFYVTKPTE